MEVERRRTAIRSAKGRRRTRCRGLSREAGSPCFLQNGQDGEKKSSQFLAKFWPVNRKCRGTGNVSEDGGIGTAAEAVVGYIIHFSKLEVSFLLLWNWKLINFHLLVFVFCLR